MKKTLVLLGILTLIIGSLFGCKKKTKTKVVTSIEESTTAVQEVISNNEDLIKDDSTINNLSNVDIDSLILDSNSDDTGFEQYTEEDFNDLKFNSVSSSFKVKSIKTKTKIKNKTVIIKKELRGTIYGLEEEFLIEVPFSQEVAKNDKIDVSYKEYFNYDTDETYISDIELKFIKEEIIKEENNISTPSELDYATNSEIIIE